MYPIFLNNPENGIPFETLKENLISICRSHQIEGRASAFAFIIYNFFDEHVIKILHDKIYWDSLNAISGKYLTVFSLFDSYAKTQLENKGSQWTSTMSYDAFKVNTEKNTEISYKEIINTFFGEIEFQTPSILFFQVCDNKITDHFLVALKEEKVEDGFLEIKRIIKDSIEAVKDIHPENMENHIEIFNMIKINVNASQFWKKVKRVGERIFNVVSFLSLFK